MNISLDDIIYHPTSRQTQPNKIMKGCVLPFLKENKVKNILDFGCGRYLRDSLLLSSNGFKVDAVDLKEQIERIDEEKAKSINRLSAGIPSKDYDAILLNFVIQTLPTKEQRRKVLKTAYDRLKKGYYFILSVRDSSNMKRYAGPTRIKFNDGFIINKNSPYLFVRGYKKKEVTGILSSLDLKIIKMYDTGTSYIAISKK